MGFEPLPMLGFGFCWAVTQLDGWFGIIEVLFFMGGGRVIDIMHVFAWRRSYLLYEILN